MLNMIKSKSLYNDGMKVLFYSEKRQECKKKKDEEKGWARGGDDYSYFQNNYKKSKSTVFGKRQTIRIMSKSQNVQKVNFLNTGI